MGYGGPVLLLSRGCLRSRLLGPCRHMRPGADEPCSSVATGSEKSGCCGAEGPSARPAGRSDRTAELHDRGDKDCVRDVNHWVTSKSNQVKSSPERGCIGLTRFPANSL